MFYKSIKAIKKFLSTIFQDARPEYIEHIDSRFDRLSQVCGTTVFSSCYRKTKQDLTVYKLGVELWSQGYHVIIRHRRLVTLTIPAGTTIFVGDPVFVYDNPGNEYSQLKCRAAMAVVNSIVDTYGAKLLSTGSMYDHEFRYNVGEMVVPTEPFETNDCVECASGIHFFLTKEEALQYEFW